MLTRLKSPQCFGKGQCAIMYLIDYLFYVSIAYFVSQHQCLKSNKLNDRN